MQFAKGRTWDEYENDLILRSTVERQFEIAGEALAQLRQSDADTAERIPKLAQVVGLRNILIHGYVHVDNATVWRTVTIDAAESVAAITALLELES